MMRPRRLAIIPVMVLVLAGACGGGGEGGDLKGLLAHVNTIRVENGGEPWDSVTADGFKEYVKLTRADCESETRRMTTYERELEEDGQVGAQFYIDRLAFICAPEAADLAQFHNERLDQPPGSTG